MGKFLKDHPITGIGLYTGPVLIVLGFVMDGLHMVEIFPPPILEGIGAAIFSLAIIGILHKWYRLAISAPNTTVRVTRRPTTSDVSASAGFFRAIIFGILFVGVFVGIIGTYSIFRYIEYRNAIENTRLEVYNLAIVPPDAPRAPTASPGLFANIFSAARGPYKVVGERSHAEFKYTNKEMTREEEDVAMKVIDAATPEPNRDGSEYYPGTGPWFSAEDPKFTKEEWQDVMAGQRFVYLVGEHKYLVENKLRITEFCFIVTKYFPTIHNCLDHSKSFSRL